MKTFILYYMFLIRKSIILPKTIDDVYVLTAINELKILFSFKIKRFTSFYCPFVKQIKDSMC